MFFNKHSLKVGLRKVKYLVLDEADRMLDMGFGPEMKKLVSYPGMPPKDKRQTLMFSATFPEGIQRWVNSFHGVENPFAGSQSLAFTSLLIFSFSSDDHSNN